jgi:hypothetical protein
MQTVTIGKRITTCVIATARSEERYIVEWLKHYKSIGFTHAYVFDNNDTPTLNEIVRKANLSDFCTIDESYVGIRDPEIQYKAYTKAYASLKNKYDWFGIFDIDEFLHIFSGGDISSFLQNPGFRNFDEVRVHWRTFTDNGLVRDDGRSVVARFTTHLPLNSPYNEEVKSLVRGGLNNPVFGCHGAKNVKACDTEFRTCKSSIANKIEHPTTWNLASVDHYRTRTVEEFIKYKTLRKEVYRPDRTMLKAFFDLNGRTKEKEEVARDLLGDAWESYL